MNATIPVLGFAAFSGTGKTTLLTQLVPLLRQRGWRIGVIKHSHHSFEIDKQGKDSYILRQAGALQTIIASSRRTVVIEQHQPVTTLERLLQWLASDDLHIILVEGFKHYSIPKIEIYRPVLGYPPLYRRDPTIIAVATDAPLNDTISLPILDINAPEAIANFIQHQFLTLTL